MRTFGIILTVLSSFFSFSQEWSVYMEDEGISIEYASLNLFVDSLVGEQLLFKYSNKSDHRVKLKFVRHVRYSGSPNSKISKRKFKLELEPNQVVQGKLTDGLKDDTPLHLFVGWKQKPRQIESFRIEKINYKILK